MTSQSKAVQEAAVFNIFPTICADEVGQVRDFYCELFELEVVFDSGWYVQLGGTADPSRQIGIVQRTHESVPVDFQHMPTGVLVAIEVDDVDAVHERAVTAGYDTVQALRSEDFGQRHFMICDPAGTLVDVITEIEPSDEVAQFGATTVSGAR